jgi:acyl-CoA thioester hydrolase
LNDEPFVHRHRVRHHELDPHARVYNARYLEYVDVAMIEFLRDLGWSFDEAPKIGLDPLLAHVEIDFRSPAVFDDELEIAVCPQRVGSAGVDIVYLISASAGALIAEVTVAYVNVDPSSRRPADVPSVVHKRLEPRLRPV